MAKSRDAAPARASQNSSKRKVTRITTSSSVPDAGSRKTGGYSSKISVAGPRMCSATCSPGRSGETGRSATSASRPGRASSPSSMSPVSTSSRLASIPPSPPPSRRTVKCAECGRSVPPRRDGGVCGARCAATQRRRVAKRARAQAFARAMLYTRRRGAEQRKPNVRVVKLCERCGERPAGPTGLCDRECWR